MAQFITSISFFAEHALSVYSMGAAEVPTNVRDQSFCDALIWLLLRTVQSHGQLRWSAGWRSSENVELLRTVHCWPFRSTSWMLAHTQLPNQKDFSNAFFVVSKKCRCQPDSMARHKRMMVRGAQKRTNVKLCLWSGKLLNGRSCLRIRHLEGKNLLVSMLRSQTYFHCQFSCNSCSS